MRIFVNGDTREVAAPVLAEALAELGYAGAVVATAVTEAFVPAVVRARTARGA